MEHSRVMLLQPSPAARDEESLSTLGEPAASCAAGICHAVKQNATTHLSNAFHGDLWPSVAQPRPCRVVCRGNSWQALSRARRWRCHAATGISGATRWCRVTVNMLVLSWFLLQQPQNHDQSNRDNTEREDLGGLDGQKGDELSMGKVRLSEVLLKILSTIASAVNNVLMRSLPRAFKFTVLCYFSSKNMFKIAVTVTSTTGKRLIIMILGKIFYIKQDKINTNNQTFTPITYKQHFWGLYSVEKAKDKLTCW